MTFANSIGVLFSSKTMPCKPPQKEFKKGTNDRTNTKIFL